jgi:pilus assembly protein CpaC
MHPTTHARWTRTLAGILLAAGLAGAAANGQPLGQPAPKDNVGEVKVDAKTGALVVPVGGLVRFDPRLPKGEIPTDILVSRDDIVQVRLDPNNPGILLLTGRTPGLSRLSVVLKDRPRLDYDVIVQPDYDLLRNLIRRTVPTANVEITPGIGNVVILSGYVTSPQDADTIARLAISQVGGSENNVVNALQVGGVQQVQIDVVIASVDRNEIRSRGFDFSVNTRTTQFSSVLSGLLTPPISGGAGGAAGIATFSPDANLQLGLVPAQFFGAIRALRTEGLAKFLAEPRVVTQTGRIANFRAGGQQAILSPASGINGPGVVLQPFGTELDVLPIVYGNGQIWLEINPRVTAVSQGLGITTVFGATPGFTEQSARCAVMLESGQTFAIGGLIQNSVQASAARVPVLGDLPYVGTLFSRVNHEERESELVILVTPRLVAPMDCNQVPRRLPGRETRNPDDYELFLEGILEAPRGQRKVWNGRCYNAAYKCDPSLGTMPCAGNVCTGPNATGNCNANGCAVPSHTLAAGRPAAFPVPSVPQKLPASVPQEQPVDVPQMPEPVAPALPVNVPEPEVSVPMVPVTQVGPEAPISPADEIPDAPPK